MSDVLCMYYSRTGNTRATITEMAEALGAEVVELRDDVERRGFFGWLRSGMDAMARKIPAVVKPETKLPLSEYDLVIIGTPVWAGRCSSPVRSFLLQFGEELKEAAYVITRGSDVRYEEVFEQMDLYVQWPHKKALTIRPDTVGSSFWKKDFLSAVFSAMEKEEQADA